MRTRTLLFWVVLALPAAADETKTIDAEKGEKAVKEQLEKYKAQGGQVTQVKDAGLGKTFPHHIFFTAHFRQFPIARALPEPLKFANIFAYSAEGKLTLLNEPKALEKFFKENARAVKDLDPAKDAARAWLKLSPELQQDGFFKFAVMDDSTKAAQIKDTITATGKVVVMQGGNGEIDAKLTFEDGKLVKVEETSKIKAGPRPICQATKLLEADPIVRRMAEQDLLIMGRAAKPYLDEQRGKAPPELQKAIDRLWQRILKEDR
jgi:hypothetical protein